MLKQCENNIISYLILLQYSSFNTGYILKVITNYVIISNKICIIDRKIRVY